MLATSCADHPAEPAGEVEAAGEARPAVMMAPSSAQYEESVDKLEVAPEAPVPPPPGGLGAPATNGATPAATRKLVYHAEVQIKVADLALANQQVDSLIRAFGAYAEEISETRVDERWQHEVKLRVAPARFEALLSGLNRLGTLRHKELSTDDVTTQHADISARLRSKRALEQRYLALLGQARKVADILEIEENMGEIRENIEATESRLRTLDNEVAYSTITLNYYQELARPTPDQPVLSFGSRLLESFYSGWQLLTNLVLGVVANWPLVALLGLAVAMLRVWRQRRRGAA
ncbi:DUF4349 domain-containing protein [Hymenobacter canadensis]|uniref:DUF4349 domain-containing protein n=1 Tax=Hymenobacter canadensis TaxID=2999067 RepID=A0ABY7LQK2_9BACT|nr:DUF4349 domain-containing protein [Hymenobacter canadensis]WBA42695.1 DUF4349 domain-containing protein [Hymenobacter canadensis]